VFAAKCREFARVPNSAGVIVAPCAALRQTSGQTSRSRLGRILPPSSEISRPAGIVLSRLDRSIDLSANGNMVENAMALDRKKSEVKRPIETLDAEVPSPKGTWKKDVSFALLPFAIEV